MHQASHRIHFINPVIPAAEQQIVHPFPAHPAMRNRAFFPFYSYFPRHNSFQRANLPHRKFVDFIYPDLRIQHRIFQQFQSFINLVGFRAEILFRAPLLLLGFHNIETQARNLGCRPIAPAERAHAHPKPVSRFSEEDCLRKRIRKIQERRARITQVSGLIHGAHLGKRLSIPVFKANFAW